VTLLTTQLASGDEIRTRNALQVIAELKLTDMGSAVAQLLDSEDPALQRRAVSVLGQIGSHAADDRLLEMLSPDLSLSFNAEEQSIEPQPFDEKGFKTLLETATNLGIGHPGNLALLLKSPSFAIRDTLERQLATHIDVYGPGIKEKLMQELSMVAPREVEGQGTRSILRIFQRADIVPDEDWFKIADALNARGDAGVRLEVQRLAEHWLTLTADQPDLQERIKRIIAATAPSAAADSVLNTAP
jgi:hypothetical protein